ncbi:MAG TPA: ABC transporter ATP-binding protein [Acidimicrobiia bacterium]|nr:ABC transporter ATP-binding protein [Acidimicrobiia bacterium]
MTDHTTSNVIQVSGLGRDFGVQRALVDVDMTVEAGEIRGLLGPNGAGKTTLLRIVAGLVDPSAGTVTVLGREWSRDRRWLRSSIGWVPAGERSFYLRLSGLENLIFFCRLHGHSLGDARRESHRLLEVVGLSGAATKRVAIYSHGMQRRLALARALIGEPRLLILDEVTSGLDPEAAIDTKEGVKRAAQAGTAVVWATQRIEELRGLADTTTLLHEGRARFDGPVQELMTYASGMMYVVELRPGSHVDFEMANASLRGLGEVKPTSSSRTVELLLDDGAPVGEAIVRLEGIGIEIQACRESRDSLELAFVRIIGAAT